MPKYKITIRRTLKEDYDMELEGNNTMEVFDQAREMARVRNETSNNGVYSVIKIEDIKENT